MNIMNYDYLPDGTKLRKTNFTGQDFMNRHRLFGKELALVDVDGIHYDNCIPTDMIEIKHINQKELNLKSANMKCLRNVADKLEIPFFIIFYNPSNWSFWILQNNDNPNIHKYCPLLAPISERKLVYAFYKIRNKVCPQEIFNNLSNNLPDPNTKPIIIS